MMFKDWIIKREIKKMTKPKIPFEEYCAIKNITLDCDTVQGNTKVKAKVAANITICILLCCIIAVILLVFLIPKNQSAPPIGLKHYGADVAEYERISIELFEQSDAPILMDFNKSAITGSIYRITPREESLLLGYFLNRFLYGFIKDEQPLVFELSMTIRCYTEFIFLGYDKFDNLQTTYGNECKYSIFNDTKSAIIKISRGGYEYFITAAEYGNDTPVDDGTVRLLIQDILQGDM